MPDDLDLPPAGADPLGDRLHAFGSQIAQATVLPPVAEIHRGGDLRRRRQRLATAGAVLAVATIIGGAVITSQLGNRGDESLLPATQTPSPTVTTPTATTPEVTPTVAATASPTQTPTITTPEVTPTLSATRSPKPRPPRSSPAASPPWVLFRGADGWSSGVGDKTLAAIGRPNEKYRDMCLSDPRPNPPGFECDVQVNIGKVLVGAQGDRVWEPGQVDGWTWESGVMACPVPGGGDTDHVIGGVAPTKSSAPIGSKTAQKYTYEMTCQSGATFRVVQYWLQYSGVRVTDYLENPDIDLFLSSFTFGGA